MADKFVSILGFARRAGKAVYGYDELKKARKVKLLCVSASASDNLSDGMKKLAQEKKVPLITAEGLETIAGSNIKAIGITDAHMADGILEFIKTSDTPYKITKT